MLLWLFFLLISLGSSLYSSDTFFCQVGDLHRPLVSHHDESLIQGQTSEVSREFDLEEACFQNEELLRSSLTEEHIYKQRLPSSSSHLNQGKVFEHSSSLSKYLEFHIISYQKYPYLCYVIYALPILDITDWH